VSTVGEIDNRGGLDLGVNAAAAPKSTASKTSAMTSKTSAVTSKAPTLTSKVSTMTSKPPVESNNNRMNATPAGRTQVSIASTFYSRFFV